MKQKFFALSVIATILLASCSINFRGKGKPVDHQEWDTIVKKYVDKEGLVDYKGLIAKDKDKLNAYCDKLSKNAPGKKWSEDEKLAYWLNAYNAFTVKLIVDNYPVKSIKDLGANNPIIFINTAWDKKFFEVNGKTMTLNRIEHKIIRQNFSEPRIHFALVCASMSCPKLRQEAYTAAKLDEQLTDQAKSFLADKNRNVVTATDPKVSSLFDWYGMDMKKWTKFTVVEYINQYAPVKINDGVKLQYLDYDWSLNEQGKTFK